MQRINIAVDLDNNELLLKEIEEAIEGAVKGKVREVFQSTAEKEVQRIIGKRLEDWTFAGYGRSVSRFQQEVKKQIDEKIVKAIGKIDVTPNQIKDQINSELNLIPQKIDREIAKKIDNISVEEYLAKIVADEVKKAYPEKLLKLIVKSLSD